MSGTFRDQITLTPGPVGWKSVIGLLPLIVAGVLATLHFGYTPDDSYIYFQYAQNLFRDYEFAFNRGEVSYGITGPLWLVLTAAGGLVGQIPLHAKVLDLLFALTAVWLFGRLAGRILRGGYLPLLATLVFATHIWFVRWASSGMETSAAVCVMLGSILLWADGKSRAALLGAGMLTLLRPEGGVLGLVLLGDMFLADRTTGGTRRSKILPVLLFSAAPLAWTVVAYLSFGSIIPNTAVAKAGRQFTIAEMTDTLVDLGKTVALSDGIMIAAALLCGLLFLRRQTSGGQSEPNPTEQSASPWRFSRLVVSFALLVGAYYVLSGTNIVSRYTLLFTPPLTIVALHTLAVTLARPPLAAWASRIPVIVAAVTCVLNLTLYSYLVLPHVTAFERGMNGALIPIGEWLRVHSEPGAKVAVTDVGAVGFYADRYICDMGGLISRDALAVTAGGKDSYDAIRDRAYESFCDADYVIHRSTRAASLADQPDLEVIMAKPFSGLAMTDHREYYYTLYRVRR